MSVTDSCAPLRGGGRSALGDRRSSVPCATEEHPRWISTCLGRSTPPAAALRPEDRPFHTEPHGGIDGSELEVQKSSVSRAPPVLEEVQRTHGALPDPAPCPLLPGQHSGLSLYAAAAAVPSCLPRQGLTWGNSRKPSADLWPVKPGPHLAADAG